MSNRITEPQNGGKIFVIALPGNEIQFDFDISAASLERVDNGLVFSFPEGQVIVENFFTFEGEELPTFALEDGSVFSGNDLLAAFDAGDLATASGPQSGNTGSGTTYNDDSGQGVEGIEAQGAQDGFAGPGNAAPGGAFEQYSPNFVASADSASGPGAFAPPSGNTPSAPGGGTGFEPGPGSGAGPTVDMNALFIVQQNALGNYETSLARLQGMIQDFYEGLEGQSVGTVSFGAVLFAGGTAANRTLGPIEVDFNDPNWRTSATESLESAVNDLLNNAHNVKTSDFGIGFKAATDYVTDNWVESDAVNKVFFVSNGSMSRSSIDENGNTVGWSNTAGSVTGSSASSGQWGYVTGENGKELVQVNDFQVAVDAFNNFVDQAAALTGSKVDVHALGVTSGYGNNMIGDNLTQYNNKLLSFFDNTGSGGVEADDHVQASKNGKELYLDNTEDVDPGAAASVAGYDLLGKMALAAALGNEYTAMQINSSGLVEGDDNHIAYLKGGKLDVEFGAGDDIVYAGGSGTINLGDGDNYVNTAFYQGVNIIAGDGDNYAHINNCGAKVAFGEGADTIMLAGGFNNTINVGGGDDLVVVHNRGNVITLGDGNDTVELNWMIENNDKLSEDGSMTKVVAMATNTITDFTVGEDVLNIGNLIGNEQSMDDFLKDNARLELDDGGNLRITFTHSEGEEGYYRGNGGEQGWNYNVSAGQVATSEVVLQNFTANNSQFSNADLTSNDLSADEQALHTLMQILGSSG